MDALQARRGRDPRAQALVGYAQPQARAAFDRAMKELQEKFLALKVDERDDPFSYVWDTMEHGGPTRLREARKLSPRRPPTGSCGVISR